MQDRPKLVIRVVKHGKEVSRELMFEGQKLAEMDKPELINFIMQAVSSLRDW